MLMEEFGRMREIVDDVAEVREEAKRMAVEWRGKMKLDNSSEVFGFLQLLIAFGLVGEFAFDEILNLFYCVSQIKRAPELFRALGFADKASGKIFWNFCCCLHSCSVYLCVFIMPGLGDEI